MGLGFWLAAFPAVTGQVCSSGACGSSGSEVVELDDVGLLQARTSRRSHMRRDDPSFTIADLGPLAGLLGTWEGSAGLSVTPLPHYMYHVPGTDPNIEFELRHHSFNDTITFAPILGAVANRGYEDAKQLNPDGQADQFLLGIEYTQTVYSIPGGSNRNSPPYVKPELLHEESGQWMFNRIPGVVPDWSVTRMSVIPHGVSVMALGKNRTQSGEEVAAYFAGLVPEMQSPTSGSYGLMPLNVGDSSEFPGQVGHYSFNYAPVQLFSPADVLVEGLGNETSGMTAIRLDVSTMAAGGSLGILPSVEAQVHPTNFNSTFWIETFADGRQQLQYIQSLMFRFQAAFYDRCLEESPTSVGCLIQWPHTLASTLKKVKDYECPPNLIESGVCSGGLYSTVR